MSQINKCCRILYKEFPDIWNHISDYDYTIFKYKCRPIDEKEGGEPNFVMRLETPECLELLWAPAVKHKKRIIVVVGDNTYRIANKLGLIVVNETYHSDK